MWVPVKKGATWWLRTLFAASARWAWVTEPLRRLAFIHFARWTIVDRLPDGDGVADGDGVRLTPPWLLFESNFEGDLPRYIDTFARILPVRMRSVWAFAHGYPGLKPIGPFSAWAVDNAFDESHYYSAYPEATPAMVGAALAVQRRFDEFLSERGDFEAAWRRFLTDVQGDL
jgi:hypothetical protein